MVIRLSRRTTNWQDRRVLITAGPTWVPIDSVRIISNIATGQTGILLAEKLQSYGAQVTLLLGPGEYCRLSRKIKVKRFKFFAQLKQLLLRELRSKRFDIVIHSAAISDYRPTKTYARKLSSSLKGRVIRLVATEKIIDLVKRIDRDIFLVGFKFGPELGRASLIKEARSLIRHSGADLVVANNLRRNKYAAYLVNRGVRGPVHSKEALVHLLSTGCEFKIVPA